MSSGADLRPLVSVVVPVYNDGDRLKLCLRALERQSYPHERLEVIVVDNGSDEPAASDAPSLPDVRFAREEKPGSYAARNTGISLSQGDVLAFTDADCIPAPEWLENGVDCLTKTPRCGLVGGRINVFPRDQAHPGLVERFEMLFSLNQEGAVRDAHYAVTANLITYRRTFDDVGLFDADLKSGGDREWGERVYARGYVLAYCDEARVDHPARDSLKNLYRKRIRVTGGLHDLDTKERKTASGIRFIIHRAKMWKPPVRMIANLLSGSNVTPPGRISTRLGLAMIALLLHYGRQVEFLRLMMGGRSRNC